MFACQWILSIVKQWLVMLLGKKNGSSAALPTDSDVGIVLVRSATFTFAPLTPHNTPLAGRAHRPEPMPFPLRYSSGRGWRHAAIMPARCRLDPRRRRAPAKKAAGRTPASVFLRTWQLPFGFALYQMERSPRSSFGIRDARRASRNAQVQQRPAINHGSPPPPSGRRVMAPPSRPRAWGRDGGNAGAVGLSCCCRHPCRR